MDKAASKAEQCAGKGHSMECSIALEDSSLPSVALNAQGYHLRNNIYRHFPSEFRSLSPSPSRPHEPLTETIAST